MSKSDLSGDSEAPNEMTSLHHSFKYPKYSTLKQGQIRESLVAIDFGKMIG